MLDVERVVSVFRECLFENGEDTADAVIAEGIILTAGFHPGRLLAHSEEIAAMLAELPVQFQAKGGGGYSFLGADQDKHGNQWAGDHRHMEELLLLGIASGKATITAPRKMWRLLPGGMPYFVVGGEENGN